MLCVLEFQKKRRISAKVTKLWGRRLGRGGERIVMVGKWVWECPWKWCLFHSCTHKFGLTVLFPETSCQNWFEKKHGADRKPAWGRPLQDEILWKHLKEALPLGHHDGWKKGPSGETPQLTNATAQTCSVLNSILFLKHLSGKCLNEHSRYNKYILDLRGSPSCKCMWEIFHTCNTLTVNRMGP